MKKVYLAGPISGKSWDDSEEWRNQFTNIYKIDGVQYFSPLRGKHHYLAGEKEIGDHYSDTILSNQKAIMSRDFFDVTTADALIAYLSESTKVSIGTAMEIAWAYQRQIPIIIINNNEVNTLHDHVMLREAAGWWVNCIEDAHYVLATLFHP